MEIHELYIYGKWKYMSCTYMENGNTWAVHIWKMEIHELFGDVKCGVLFRVWEEKGVLNCMRALGMKYIFRPYINRGRWQCLWCCVARKVLWARFELVSKMVLDWTLGWKIPQEPRALQKQTRPVERNKIKRLPLLESANKWIAV